MARTSRAALGRVETPFGVVSVRIERASNKSDRHFACQGPTLALRWLFRQKVINNEQTRIRVVPSQPLTTDEAIAALFQEMLIGWDYLRKHEAAQTLRPSDPGTFPADGGPTLDDLIADAERDAVLTVRASTLSAYQYEWKAVRRLIPGSTAIRHIDRSLAVAALTNDRLSGTAPETLRKHHVALSRLLTRAVSKGIIGQHPLGGIRLPKVPRRQAVFLTREERDRILSAAAKSGQDYFLLFACGVYLGMRKAELLALKWEYLDFQQKVAQILNTDEFTTKNGRNRSVPMCADLIQALTPYRRSTGYVLKPLKPMGKNRRYRWEFKDGFQSIVKAAGLDTAIFTPHTLRHSFASIMAQAGVSLYKIGQWMGHSTSEVTELYAHLAAFDDDIERLGRDS